MVSEEAAADGGGDPPSQRSEGFLLGFSLGSLLAVEDPSGSVEANLGDGGHVDGMVNALTDQGVRLVGRLAGARAQFSGSLPNKCALAAPKLGRLLVTFDEWAADNGMDRKVEAPTVSPPPGWRTTRRCPSTSAREPWPPSCRRPGSGPTALGSTSPESTTGAVSATTAGW